MLVQIGVVSSAQSRGDKEMWYDDRTMLWRALMDPTWHDVTLSELLSDNDGTNLPTSPP